MNLNFSTNSVIPWVIVFFMTLYVFGLSYFATHRTTPEPTFDFYNSSKVIVQVKNIPASDTTDDHVVMGIFNNIIEGQKKTVEATSLGNGLYNIPFQVNSPRAASLFVNDEAIEIFLVPDSTLRVEVFFNLEEDRIDSLAFQGNTANICHYYLSKSEKFKQMHIRSYRNTIDGDSLERHAWVLDSLAVNELAYLLIRSQPDALPFWFIHFEKNEILYQKAYLKLSNSYNREVYPGYLETVEINNPDAVFSYYYYLYLRTLVSQQDAIPGVPPAAGTSNMEAISRQLAIADTLFKDEIRDVFITSVIFSSIQNHNKKDAAELFSTFGHSFSKKKYERFLNKQIEEM